MMGSLPSDFRNLISCDDSRCLERSFKSFPRN
jgi:hypothetical protein